MFLIFRDAFAVRVAFGVPDFAVAEVVAFDVLFVEVDSRDSFNSKDRSIRAARLRRFGERAGFFHFEGVVGADLPDRFAYLHEIPVHRFRYIESDGGVGAAVAVEQVGDFI